MRVHRWPARPRENSTRHAPSCPKPRPSGIYLVGPDGLDPHWLAAGVEPAWSADGTELAYSTGRFLAIQGVDGDPPRDVIVALPTVLAESGVIGGPSWSPDGRQIVFSFFHTDTSVAGDEWREDLYTVDVATVDGAAPHGHPGRRDRSLSSVLP